MAEKYTEKEDGSRKNVAGAAQPDARAATRSNLPSFLRHVLMGDRGKALHWD